jgi:hypothetical protein
MFVGHYGVSFAAKRIAPTTPLYDKTAKVEAALLFGGMWLFFGTGLVPRPRMLVFGLVMLAIQAYVFFGPPPESDQAFAWTALAEYAGFAAVVARLERPSRASRSH